MAEPFIGEIKIFGGSFAPRGWALCNGDLLAISGNTALFAILGTTYGGDGRTTFALPDLRSRLSVHSGNGSAGIGLPAVQLGERGGAIDVTLNANNIAGHTHPGNLRSVVETANATIPVSAALGITSANQYYSGSTAPSQNMATGSVTVDANSGGGTAVNIRNPYLGLNFIIALEGTFPSRN
ncbi:MAG: tail fiber protein [Cyanobacteria bacterium P01_F01_bin.143]